MWSCEVWKLCNVLVHAICFVRYFIYIVDYCLTIVNLVKKKFFFSNIYLIILFYSRTNYVVFILYDYFWMFSISCCVLLYFNYVFIQCESDANIANTIKDQLHQNRIQWINIYTIYSHLPTSYIDCRSTLLITLIHLQTFYSSDTDLVSFFRKFLPQKNANCNWIKMKCTKLNAVHSNFFFQT